MTRLALPLALLIMVPYSIKKEPARFRKPPALSYFYVNQNTKSMSNIQEEIWKDVVGYEGYYRISNQGNLISLKSGTEHYVSLKPHKTKGYIETHLTSPYNSGTGAVHRLVAKHFLMPPKNPKATSVNHKNGIKTDNRIENLEWVTHSENMQHAYDTGLIKRPPNDFNFKLTIDQAISIKKLQLMGMSNDSIGKLYGMTGNQMQNLKKRGWHILKDIYRLY